MTSGPSLHDFENMQLNFKSSRLIQKLDSNQSMPEIMSHELHNKMCELACISALIPEMNLEYFAMLTRLLANNCSLKQSFEQIASSAILNRCKEDTNLWSKGQKALEVCEKQGFQILYPGHDLYPSEYLNLAQPPFFLSFKGTPAWLTANKIAVVGSRDASFDAKNWMELHFDSFLKLSRTVTVSGAAYGIDQLVHRISLRNFLPTIALIPSGLSQIYPRQFAYEIKAIVESGGAIVSEFLPGVEMKKHHFEKRNRLICGLTNLLFVVEAKRKSGSIMTARLALEQNKTICILPSSPMQTQNLGALDLLFDGVHPLRDEQDLLCLLQSEVSSRSV